MTNDWRYWEMLRSTLLVFFLALVAAHGASCTKNSSVPEALVPDNSNRTSREEKNAVISGSRQNAITKVAKDCSPAIVGINVTELREYQDPFFDPWFDRFFPQMRQRYTQKVQSLGSGFLVSSDGYIITNDHVAGRASKIVVTTTDGEKFDAEIIGSDRTSDVALLKIKGKNLPYLKFGNSDDVQVGEWAIAFGNPFGLFDKNSKPTVTVGVVSNTGVSFTENAEGYTRVYKGMIQTDAAISSGNSGGPLINVDGEVIGMNTIIFSTSQSSSGAGSIGIGFAIPINRVRTIMEQLRNGIKADRSGAFTGLGIFPLSESNAKQYQTTHTEGVIVTQVSRNSPADKAGISPLDIILEVDGTPIRTIEDFNVLFDDAVVGQTLKLKIERDGEVLQKKITIEKFTPDRRR